jgi:hypothetical protein
MRQRSYLNVVLWFRIYVYNILYLYVYPKNNTNIDRNKLTVVYVIIIHFDKIIMILRYKFKCAVQVCICWNISGKCLSEQSPVEYSRRSLVQSDALCLLFTTNIIIRKTSTLSVS